MPSKEITWHSLSLAFGSIAMVGVSYMYAQLQDDTKMNVRQEAQIESLDKRVQRIDENVQRLVDSLISR